jgi:beta-galactosidase
VLMKRSCLWGFILIIWCLSVSADQVMESYKEPIAVMNLCGDWEFAYTLARTEEVPPAKMFGVTMPVPGCWDDQFSQARAIAVWPKVRFNPDYHPVRFPDISESDAAMREASLPYLVGTGWYHRQIDVPAEWKGRQITLQMGRVVMEAWVYVNGRMVHHHLGHSTNWEVPLAPHLAFGRPNELMIAVDNTRRDRVGCEIRGWNGQSGGIFGPVAIRVAGSARIADVYVFPDENTLNWRIELQGDLPQSSRLEWKILDPTTKQVVVSGTQPVAGPQTCWTCDKLRLKPWSNRQPNLYQLEVGLYAEKSCLDVCGQPFGLRRLTTAGTSLQLNGQPIYWRGASDDAQFPLTTTPPLDGAWYRRHITLLKQLGFNAIRCHTWVPTEPYLMAADELGILFQVEPPVGYTLAEWRDILRACRKHPSVVIYCCGNEELLDEAKIEYLRQCQRELRSLVPDGVFEPQEALRGVEYCWNRSNLGNDVVDKPYPHNPSRLARLKEFSDVLGQYTWGWLSYDSLLGESEKIDQRLTEYERPCLVHELGICGCYLDLNLEQRYQKLRIGPDLYVAARRELQNAGLLHRADVYYRNSAAWQRLMFKDAVETARRCRLLAGYAFWGINDYHWVLCGFGCGLLNEFDEMKPGRSVADVLGYNNESVLLIDRQRQRNLVAGKPLCRDVFLSWFGDGTLKDATLHWSLSGADGTKLANGQQALPPVEAGTLQRIAAVRIPTPALNRPTKSTLVVEVVHSGKPLRNQWDYWLFPDTKQVVPKDVLVASTLDDATVTRLIAGDRVVLLGSKPLSAREMNFQISVAGRPHGNFATVIAKHPLMAQFPHDGYCDWQFYPMLTGAAAVQFDVMPEAIDPIVEIVSSYKRIRRQAVVFEWRVGKGRLLVCSLRLPDSDPAARYFRGRMIDYAASALFQPHITVAPEQLMRLLRCAPAAVQSMDKTVPVK